MTFKQVKHISKENLLLLVIYCCVLMFCIFNDPIYSFDTYSYLRAMPYRQMGYVIFLKSFSYVFGSYFEELVVLIHAIVSLFGVHYFYKQVSSIFNLNNILKFILVGILLIPFFSPLLIANNLCSEGLGYGLYLLFIAIGLNILFKNKRKDIKFYVIVFLVLVSVRSQFLISTLIFAGVYFLMYRKSLFQRKHLLTITIFCGLVLVASISERSYHKLKDGFFKPTPLGFTSASTAPIYISDTTDYLLIDKKDYREILKMSYNTLTNKDLLLKPNQTPEEDYLFFHKNLPKICNQTVREEGVAYYFKQTVPEGWSENQANSYPFFEAEAACKVYTFTLIKAHFKKWVQLFYTNLTYGFYSPLILFFVVIMFFFSLIKTTFYYQKKYAVLFLLSSLILSNALFIAFASHSIQRYLFYNYALLFLLFISTLKLLKRE